MASIVHPATAASGAAPARLQSGRSNLLVRWHLLSLDAPSVAMLWTWFLAASNHVRLPVTSVIAMGVAVWMLYAADRLLDARFADGAALDLELRHLFHREHRRGFLAGIIGAGLVLGLLLPSLTAQSMRLYLILGAMLFTYFILIHASRSSVMEKTIRLPKELAVGVFFSAATFIPTVAREPALRLALLPGALLFALVCSLNCVFIYAWEHSGTTAFTHVARHPAPHPATGLALRFLPRIAIASAACGVVLAWMAHGLPWSIPAACAMASALLLLLHRNRRRFDSTTLRAAADLCLLTPLLLLPLLRY